MFVQTLQPMGLASRPSCASRKRAAYTLLELVLVLALIVTISAIAFPTLDSMYASYKVSAAADTVRAGWAMARAHAIEEGRPYRFSITPGGGTFRIAPDSDDYWTGGNTPEETSTTGEPPLVQEEKLPDGVVFADGNAPANSAPNETPGGGGGDWQTKATFLPDGTALDDVTVSFQSRGTRGVILQLRGLTGVITRKIQGVED